MADFLATKDWKSVLAQKENKSVKKTGISETLDDYASAKKKDDLGKMVSALERVIEKATEVAEKKLSSTITDFLTKTIKAAKVEVQKLELRLADKTVTEEDNEASTLGKALVRVRQMTADTAWHFVLSAGKPSSGFVISKKPIKKENIDKAFEMKGKRGVFFIGHIFFESGKYILSLDSMPPAGLAKAAKNAAAMHADMKIKVIVRGGGVDLDDEKDIEPREEGSSPNGPDYQMDTGRFSTFQGRVAQIGTAVQKFETAPNRRQEGAWDSLPGMIEALRLQIKEDPALSEGMKKELYEGLDKHLEKIKTALTPEKVDETAKYPALPYWERLAEGIVRLDPGRRDDAWEKVFARLNEAKAQFRTDTALVEPDRTKVSDLLQQAERLLRTRERETVQLFERGNETGNSELAGRFKAMERRLDQIQKTPGLDDKQVSSVVGAFTNLREEFRKGTLDAKSTRITQVEGALEIMAGKAFLRQREINQLAGQQQIREAVAPQIEFMKRASRPAGLIKDMDKMREFAKTQPAVRPFLVAMQQATQKSSAENGRAMEETARALLAADNAPPELVELAQQVLVRGTMMRLAEEYETLPKGPWTPAEADLASELQAQMFFVESAITQGNPEYQAPRLGGEGGASGSWWIERTEPKSGDKPGAKRKYIFKPAKEESAVMTGLPPGSGAPREVLAKRMDEIMSGAGFDIGVSPTTLANLDSALLGDTDQGPQVLLGSMQQLAQADGDLGDHLSDLANFSKTIDKKSFDDIAVFDMLYANLDRHAKNMMFATDPTTGKTRLVPIDHGSSMPDPEALQSNRDWLRGPFNVMASKDMAPAQQPLGDETVEALLRLDPDRLVQEMTTARNDLGKRHPQTEGTISDEAINAIAARARFVKAAAAAKVPVALIFEMLAVGALRITKAQPTDMAGLVDTLRDEIEEAELAVAEVNEMRKAFLDPNGGIDDNQVVVVLENLGWAWNATASDLVRWINDRPKAVARILRTQQVNPGLIKATEALRPAAEKAVPGITAKSAALSAFKRYMAFFTAANAELVKGPPVETDVGELDRRFQELGGMAVLKEAAKIFPFYCAKHLEDADPSKKRAVALRAAARVQLLLQYNEFQKLGGLTQLLTLGGTIPREFPIVDAIYRLQEIEMGKEALDDLNEMDEEELDEKTASAYTGGQLELQDMLNRLRNPSNRNNVSSLQDKAKSLWTRGEAGGAVGNLTRALHTGRGYLVSEAELVTAVNERVQAIRLEVGNMPQEVQLQILPRMQAVYDAFQRASTTADSDLQGQADRRFEVTKDIVARGADSDFSKLGEALQKLQPRLAQHAGLPWFTALDNRHKEIANMLAKFLLSNLQSEITYYAGCLDGSDLLLDALEGADVNNLSQAVQTIGQEWSEVIRVHNDTSKASDFAQRLKGAL